MHATSITRLGADKRGNPRVWLEGRRLEHAGFTPAARYQLGFDEVNKSITLRLAANGDRAVSRRSRGDTETPIIDINNSQLLSKFEGIETLKVRFTDGAVIISPTASDLRRIERAARLRRRLENGMPLKAGSVSTGLGILSLAIHQGLEAAGLKAELAFSVEIDERYQEAGMAVNPVWKPETHAVAMPMQEVAFDAQALSSLPQVDILEAGIPCAAASPAGRAKKSLAKPEDDPKFGHLVAGFLAIVAATNPGVLLVENVPPFQASSSFSILVNQLTEWGYIVHADTLKGADFGCLEYRNRMALVATTPGIEIDFAALIPDQTEQMKLGDILEDIPHDDKRWSTMSYLKEKEDRDLAAGKGFRMKICNETSDFVGTLGRGYSKNRSTEAKVQHPTNPDLLRLLTPIEHARVKGIPEYLISGLTQTMAHEVLGQSIVFAPFKALGQHIGSALSKWAKLPIEFAASTVKPATIIRALIPQETKPLAQNLGHKDQLPLFAF